MNLKAQFRGQNLAQNLAFIATIAIATALIIFDFKIYGDIFRYLLPLLCAILPIYTRDFDKLKELIFAILFSTLAVYLTKFCITQLVAHYDLGEVFSFARRPINMARFDGFPSGHTQGAFVGFAFAFAYFRTRWKVLFFCLALLVGISRIYSGYHTILQVLCGALVGFFISYFVIKFLQNKRI